MFIRWAVQAVALSGVRADGNGTYTNPTIHYNTPDPGALWDPETGLYWVRGAAKCTKLHKTIGAEKKNMSCCTQAVQCMCKDPPLKLSLPLPPTHCSLERVTNGVVYTFFVWLVMVALAGQGRAGQGRAGKLSCKTLGTSSSVNA